MPVTFGYLSDAHDGHGLAGEIHHAYGPGEAGYVQQLKDYDQSFAQFFARMQADGITKDNTLFVVTVEEGDHFAGTQPDDPACDGVTMPCTYENVQRGQRRPEAARRDVQREPRHERDDELQRPQRPGAERLRHRQSRPRLVDGARPREGDVGHHRDEPVLGRAAEAVRRDGRSGRGEVTPHGHGRSGADADVHAVRAGRLLPQRVVDDAVRRATTSNCMSCTTAVAEQRTGVRVEPRRHPTRDPKHLDRLGRAGRREEGRRPTRSGRITPTSGRRCSRCSG